MVKRRMGGHTSRVTMSLSRHGYTLRPTRPLAWRMAVWAVVCMLSACAGAFALKAWQMGQARGPHEPCDRCAVASADAGSRQAEVLRLRLALAEESAARGAVQKTADSAAAEVARLGAELAFLREQGTARATAPRR